jgi:hypothetical protein
MREVFGSGASSMWFPAQALVNYGELAGTTIVVVALAEWALNDGQKSWLADRSARLRHWIGTIRRRALLDTLGSSRLRRTFLAIVFLAEAVLVWHLARHVSYQGRGGAATAGDVLVAELLLFVVPLCAAALVLIKAGPRFVHLLTGSGGLPVCLGKCLAAALAADVIAHGALRAMDATFQVFGPRALLDWWDVRLWIYAVEYAVSGAIVSAMMIANLLLALCAAAGLAVLLLTLMLLQIEIPARVIARYPRGALLGSSIAVAGLAVVIKDWI